MNTYHSYAIVQGELVIRSGETQEKLWRGKPNGMSVDTVLQIPGSEDFIVLLSWRDAVEKAPKNLIRLDPLGNMVWEVGSPQVKNPPGPDRDGKNIYTAITAVNGDFIEAYAGLGYSDLIDLQTGKIVRSVFVK